MTNSTTTTSKDAHGHNVEIDIGRIRSIREKISTDWKKIRIEDEYYLIQCYQASDVENDMELKNEVFDVLLILYEKYLYKSWHNYDRLQASAIDIEDIKQQAMIGFMEGLSKFDVTKSQTRANNYTSRFIATAMAKEYHQFSGSVSKPRVGILKYQAIEKASEKYRVEHEGREPSTQDLMKMTGMKYSSVTMYRNIYHDSSFESLSNFREDGNGSEDGMYEGTKTRAFSMTYLDMDEKTEMDLIALDIAMSYLSYIQRIVVEDIIGLHGETRLTKKQCAEKHGMTVANVKLIFDTAIERLSVVISEIKESSQYHQSTMDFIRREFDNHTKNQL